jgi:preprotein translocase subunit SecB
MATSTNGPSNAPQPVLQVLAQYIKDLSFENPNAPKSLSPSAQQPEININNHVDASQVGEPDIEVSLRVDCKAHLAGTVLFNLELTYSGIFRVQNVPAQNMHPLVLIECPRLLFPFAREIVANAVRDGGFPPLLLQPVDFAALYQQKMVEMRAAAPPSAPGVPQA